MTNCVECEKPISGRYFELENGKSVCGTCYSNKYQKECVECKNKIEDTYYTVGDAFVCASCYKKKHAKEDGKLICHICKQEVNGRLIRAIDLIFHADCFSCSVCKKDLSQGGEFMSDNNKTLYCQQDYQEKFSPRCFDCKRVIVPGPGEKSALHIKALDQVWHPQCFKCKDCSLVLDSKAGKSCYPIDNVPYCKDCCEKRS